MSSDRIFCGLCGHASEAALFDHIRDAHQLTPEQYSVQCPGAPLFTPAFREFVNQQGVHAAEDGVRVTRQLLGMSVSCTAAPHPLVPSVDERFHLDPALAKVVLQSLLANDRILLVGPTGCGKSSLVAQLAARLNWPMTRINLHGETSSADFLGQNKVANGEIVYEYGVLPRAMKEGHVLVLDEMDGAGPEILFVLHSVLEDQGVLTLPDNNGEVIRPHPQFRLVATANTLGLGDETGIYAGTHVLNGAFLDRWTAVFQVGYLPEVEEKTVVAELAPTLNHALVDGLVKLANAVRKAVEKQQLYCTFSTRRLLAFAKKIEPLGLATALHVTVLNKLAPSDRAVVAELAQRHLPDLETTVAA